MEPRFIGLFPLPPIEDITVGQPGLVNSALTRPWALRPRGSPRRSRIAKGGTTWQELGKMTAAAAIREGVGVIPAAAAEIQADAVAIPADAAAIPADAAAIPADVAETRADAAATPVG